MTRREFIQQCRTLAKDLRRAQHKRDSLIRAMAHTLAWVDFWGTHDPAGIIGLL
ncbi:MAG TPA: hypothetical protein VN578_11025 [Candidatus Binatia bacterium]|jgi:hypothetical protein|nr:hypothetical protein [Candidatus Binatia bacterium]